MSVEMQWAHRRDAAGSRSAPTAADHRHAVSSLLGQHARPNCAANGGTPAARPE